MHDIPLTPNDFCDPVSGPEKAGGGGSIPSLATILFNNLATANKPKGASVARTKVRARFRKQLPDEIAIDA